MAPRFLFLITLLLQPATAGLQIIVTADGAAVAGARVIVLDQQLLTASDGRVTTQLPAGETQITVVREGFNPVTVMAVTRAGETTLVEVALEPQDRIEEQVTVSATRTDTRLDDQAMRVEVLSLEEIEEKQLMTPGDIVMMLNEMGGLRVQATSPSLGGASVRVQGMRGRYTRFLSDGLPLFGTDVGGLGLMQIPPSDLGQVEVIKGVASALYGSGALGGVVDLISRRPEQEPARDLLVNQTSRGGTDAVLFAAQPFTDRWSATLLAGGHWQQRNDVDDDGWTDLAHYSRGVVRPRVFWNDGAGRSLFATGGAMWETREGGTMPDSVLPATGASFREALETTRIDSGLMLQTPVASTRVLTARFSATHKHTTHDVGENLEDNVQRTLFSEIALRGTAPRQTWVTGIAFERSTLDPRLQPQFAYVYNVPGVFVQDDVRMQPWLTASVSARVDHHCLFGWQASPRVSALVRRGAWDSRISFGTGFFAPSALTEETEAAGLALLTIPEPLRVERGQSLSADITHRRGAVTLTGTVFRYNVRDPVVVDRAVYSMSNLAEATVTQGFDGVVVVRQEPFSLTGTYTYVHSREGVAASRADIPLTPRQSAGVVLMWEREGKGRAGFEAYFTGSQRLEDNPYRVTGDPYVLFGGLVERRIGRVRLFVNVENLADVRQTKEDSLVRPSRAADGRWTVDAWAPLDGRVINGGIRLTF